jgi:hypothetical protein
MKIFVALGMASAVAMAVTSPADAAQGCGPGSHRAPNGDCRPDGGQMDRGSMDRGPRHVTWVAGRYYPGHGYWYHNQWYHHRQRWHGDWRYR